MELAETNKNGWNEPVTKQPDSVTKQPDSVTKQPDSVVKETLISQNVTNDLPAGLKDLESLDDVIIHQHLEAGDICFQRPSRYSVYGKDRENSFLYIEEASVCFARQCLGALRGFRLNFRNNDDQVVMRVLRPVRCPCGVCWWWCCCVQEMTIESPIQNPIGNITERRLLCCPHYNITDNNDDVVFVIKFACCLCKLCCDVSIPIYHAKSGDVVSEITKASGSNWAECCGTKNDYNIKFLQPLGIHEKMLILGASFLIDFNFFENQQRSCC